MPSGANIAVRPLVTLRRYQRSSTSAGWLGSISVGGLEAASAASACAA
jgi:hypothetical protein